ncbi:MAG: cysteine--tRNA ligase, partial [Lactobacillus sp.]|nr:cysteine--tRNA ligase [Lactobacillus sp.]
KTALADFLTIFSDWLGIFGVDLTTLTTKAVDDDVINALIAKRTKAREQKNWQESDAIRDQLAEMGIKLLDTAQGTRWTRE